MTNEAEYHFEFGGAAQYKIVVQGEVDKSWSGRLAGMEITITHLETGQTTTSLVGQIRDQATLRGVLDTLYALHLPVLEVKKL